jgi:LPS-assembly protein
VVEQPREPETTVEGTAAEEVVDTEPAPAAEEEPQPVVEQPREPETTVEGTTAEEVVDTEPAPAAEEEPQPVVEQPREPETTVEGTASEEIVDTEPAPAAEEEPQPTSTAPPKEDPAVVLNSALQVDSSRIDRDLDWNQCGPLRDPTASLSAREETGDIEISADSADLLRDQQLAVFSGNVEVAWGAQLLEANEVRYNESNETLDALGGIYYQQPGLLLSSESAHLELASDSGQLERVQYRLPSRRIRGDADAANILDQDRSQYKNISYSTCAPDDDSWVMEAKELDIDQESGMGTVRNSVLKFKGTPVFYLPWATFPIDDRRKSGFLVPSIGHSGENGIDITVPYYFNIAPSMDATLYPRIMGKRGLLLGGEFRYLTDWYNSEMQAEILPNDYSRNSDEDSLRGAFSYRGASLPKTRWQLATNIHYVSDKDYVEDLSDSLAASSSRHLERRGDLRYIGDDWEFLARLQYFQTIDKTIAPVDRPYARLPQLLLSMEKEVLNPLVVYLDTEYVYFDLDDTVHGHRFDLRPGLGLRLENSWGYLTPKISAHYTSYDLEDQGSGNPNTPDRNLYTASLDTGLFLEREDNLFGTAVTQTLEPRLFYLYTPRENQDDLPVFDTSEYDLSFDSLFRENRFNGPDRVGDANQLTAALTSRTLDTASGEELLRASIGQTFYFEDREVQLPGVVDVDQSSSAIIAEIAARLSNHWRTRATAQWDPHAGGEHTRQGALHLYYRGDEGGLFNLAHRYRADLLDQSDLSFRWPISSRLHAVGRWNYSWHKSRNLENFVGFEYDSCCWILRTVARHYVNNTDSDSNTAFFVQLELKGLTSLGRDIDSFLENGILGYQSDH